MLSKLLINLLFIASQDGGSLSFKIGFNRLQLLIVELAHVGKLVLHRRDQGVDVDRHFLNRLDIVLVFLLDLALELFDELLFILDDLHAESFLRLDVLFK